VHRKFKSIFLNALTSCALLASAPMGFAENPQITVSVYDDAGVPEDTLTSAEGRAAKILESAGLEVSWLTCVRPNYAGCATTFNEIVGPAHLVLRIKPNRASWTSDTACGVAYLASDGTGQYGDIFWNRARDLQANSNVDLASILASIIAHELGHLLLGSNAHAISGIMQGHWEDDELRRIGMGSLLFLPAEGKRMRARIAQREKLLISRREGRRD
jgi:hypothetical protein